MRTGALVTCLALIGVVVGPAASASESACDSALGSWEYVAPSDPGRINFTKLANGRHVAVWISVPANGPVRSGAAEASCEGHERHWRVLFASNPSDVGTQFVEQFEIEGDTARFWILGADGKRGPQGGAHRVK